METQSINLKKRFWLVSTIGSLLIFVIIPQSTLAQTNTFPSSGNAGVGTTSPADQFEVVSGNRKVGLNTGVSGAGGVVSLSRLDDGAKVAFFGISGSPTDDTVIWGAGGSTEVRFVSGGLSSSGFGFYENMTVTTAFAATRPTPVLKIDGNGNMGIGTTTPLQRLQIGSNTGSSTTTPDAVSLGATYSNVAGANPKLRLFDNNAGAVYGLGVSNSQLDFMVPATARYVWSVNGAEKMRLDDSGNLTVVGNINAKYQDVAEWVPASEQIPAGTVVVLDSTKSNEVISSTQAYDTRVAGVVSEQPGIVLGERGVGKVLVATTGRVKVKVDASRVPIHIGDLLVTSDVSGLAMKSEPIEIQGRQMHAPGTLIGKALEPLGKGTGEILVLLSLQ